MCLRTCGTCAAETQDSGTLLVPGDGTERGGGGAGEGEMWERECSPFKHSKFCCVTIAQSKKEKMLHSKALRKGHSDIVHRMTTGCLEDLISSGSVPETKMAVRTWSVMYRLN